jgi:hypothetical protein
MEVTLKIDNPNELEQQLFEFLKQQKKELEEVTIEALTSFLSSFKKEEKLHFKKKDISKNLSVIISDDDEPIDETIKLYSHVEDSAKYIHDLRRVRNR